jgi:FMN-dependent NADH-azoreductase
MNILHVCANPKPTEESASKQLATAFFTTLVSNNPDFQVNNIDLYQDPPPYLAYEAFRGFWYPVFIDGYQPTDEDEAAMAYAKAAGEKFNEADVLVLTTPMWNFNIPAILKAWIDQVLAPGVTFDITGDGIKPLHRLRRIILLVASGGVYKEDDPRDSLSSQIRAAFQFIDVRDIDIAWADGQNPLFFEDSEQRKQFAVEAAQEIAEEIAEMQI